VDLSLWLFGILTSDMLTDDEIASAILPFLQCRVASKMRGCSPADQDNVVSDCFVRLNNALRTEFADVQAESFTDRQSRILTQTYQHAVIDFFRWKARKRDKEENGAGEKDGMGSIVDKLPSRELEKDDERLLTLLDLLFKCIPHPPNEVMTVMGTKLLAIEFASLLAEHGSEPFGSLFDHFWGILRAEFSTRFQPPVMNLHLDRRCTEFAESRLPLRVSDAVEHGTALKTLTGHQPGLENRIVSDTAIADYMPDISAAAKHKKLSNWTDAVARRCVIYRAKERSMGATA
jgi:hypothetical protein